MAAPATVQSGWWSQTKLRYRQQWKKTDPALPAQPASLGLAATAASLAGNFTGAGMLAMPFAFAGIGDEFRSLVKFQMYRWSAIVILPLIGVLAAFSASLLKSCCEILEERYEEYRRFHWYTQYSDITYRALGPALASYWLYLPLTLALVILLLVGIADNKNYADVTGTAVGAMFTLGIRDWQGDSIPAGDVLPAHSAGVLFFVGVAIIAFSFAGVCTFTNIRRDMKSPPSFTTAAAFGVAGSTLALFLVGVTGYAVLGTIISGNVVLCLKGRDIRLAADFFAVFCAQQLDGLGHWIMDEHDSVQDYGKRVAWSRAKLATPLALCACLLALAVPYEGALMALVGSLALCPVAFVLPPVFYYKLCRGSEQWPEKPLSMRMKIALGVTVFSGLLIFIGGTVTSIIQIVEQSHLEGQSCLWGFCYERQFTAVQQPGIFGGLIADALKNSKLIFG
ncbi:uncharacterized protein [Dermacentor albipictus]|uniref:uncharacterized protein n=1 Tax=Dermacentor albipictus TaxID=60249 RepID=UPI0038FD2826